MKWLTAKHQGLFSEKEYACDRDRWDIPETWLPIHYFEALNCLFRIENALRLLVYIGLKREFQERWDNITMSTEDSQSVNLRGLAKQRSRNDDQFEYLTTKLPCPLMYLTAGELTKIIFSDSYWKLFKGHLPGSKQMLEPKLREIACVRNALAHFRPVSTEQLEVIKKNGDQLLDKFDQTLKEMLFGAPFGLLEKWKIKLQCAGEGNSVNVNCSMGVSESKDWIFFTMKADGLVHGWKSAEATCRIKVSLLELEGVLYAFADFRHHCVFATHDASFHRWDGDSQPSPIQMTLRFVFPNPPGNTDPLKGLPFLPTCFAPSSPNDGVVVDDIFQIRVLIAREFSHSSSQWYISIPDILGKVDGLPVKSKFVENWDSINLSRCSDYPLTEMPRYPWLYSQTAANY